MDHNETNDEQQRRPCAEQAQQESPTAERLARMRRRVRRLLARGSAGFNLVELMVVVVIIGLLMSAVGFAVFRQLANTKKKDAEQAVRVIRSAVNLYRNDNPTGCPTTQQLVSAGILDRNQRTVDPWGTPFRIQCEGDEITVTSNGPDTREGTDDDIPPRSQQQQSQQ